MTFYGPRIYWRARFVTVPRIREPRTSSGASRVASTYDDTLPGRSPGVVPVRHACVRYTPSAIEVVSCLNYIMIQL